MKEHDADEAEPTHLGSGIENVDDDSTRVLCTRLNAPPCITKLAQIARSCVAPAAAFIAGVNCSINAANSCLDIFSTNAAPSDAYVSSSRSRSSFSMSSGASFSSASGPSWART